MSICDNGEQIHKDNPDVALARLKTTGRHVPDDKPLTQTTPDTISATIKARDPECLDKVTCLVCLCVELKSGSCQRQ